MEKILKIRLLQYPTPADSTTPGFYSTDAGMTSAPTLHSAVTARYPLNCPVDLFLCYIFPADCIKRFQLFFNTGTQIHDKITEDHFVQAENKQSFLHLLVVVSDNYKFHQVERIYQELEKEGYSDLIKEIKDFLSLSQKNCFETVYRITDVEVINVLGDFLNQHLSIISLFSEKKLVYLKYIVNNRIKKVVYHIDHTGRGQEEINELSSDNSVVGLTLNLSMEEPSEITPFKDIQIKNEPFKFGDIKRGFEDDDTLYIQHSIDGFLELRTFKREIDTENKKETGKVEIFRDTGNRVKPFDFLHGTQGETELSRKLIYSYELMKDSRIDFIQEIPGEICDIIKFENDHYFILSWQAQKKTGIISNVLPLLRPERSKMLKFGCHLKPSAFTYFKHLKLFFLAQTGSSYLFCLDNSPGCQLQDISTAFDFTKTKIDFRLPAKGEINDLETGELILSDQERIPFLSVAQVNAITLFNFASRSV
ncbi:MAG: hypothetical protein U9P10_13810 [Thermodesulfobacteriota bacterium]|nr:hypothetical protein [Thermodesulfobacteriota bacterium]